MDRGLVDLAADLRSGRLPLATYLDTLEERFTDREDALHAWVEESDRFARVRREAEALAARFEDPASRPTLYGVPVGVKDIFHVDGFATRAGSRLPPEVLAGKEGSVVTRLRAAGALILGKTVTTEFAYFASGPTRNPRNADHTPGGSSSGSAAAVAAGLTPLALGSQTIGSITRPAAYCGVVGFKPTFGRVPTAGMIPLAPSFDQVGWFASDVAGVGHAASVWVDPWDVATATAELDDAKRPVLGVLEGPYLDAVASDGRRQFDETTAWLGQCGFEVKRVHGLDDFDDVQTRHRRLLAAEAALAHRKWYEAHGDLYHEETAALIRRGKVVLGAELDTLRAARSNLRASIENTMGVEGIDIWITPSAPGAAPKGLDSTGDPVMSLPWTQAGMPTISIPEGEDDAGLPMAIQLVGHHGADESLIAWAATVSRALD
jgi:Asp-tRNA(Asn)/Glu-tRNA(Gln) amidotransferase A subunit family amidase